MLGVELDWAGGAGRVLDDAVDDDCPVVVEVLDAFGFAGAFFFWFVDPAVFFCAASTFLLSDRA